MKFKLDENAKVSFSESDILGITIPSKK